VRSTSNFIDRAALPRGFPTHRLEPALCEALGRSVATFGFLEDVLSRAIFAVTATTRCPTDKADAAYTTWLSTLESALVDPLGNLIDLYGKWARQNADLAIESLDELLEKLRQCTKIRNAICHGMWGLPDAKGAVVPFFVSKQKEIFDTPIDVAFLDHLCKGVTELACDVIDTVTRAGWQFPGSTGPGEVIWKSEGQASSDAEAANTET
jgi:hypothetical protein